MHQRFNLAKFTHCAPVVALILILVAFSSPVLAKELASEAINTAIGDGTFAQVREAMVMDSHLKQRYIYDEDGIEAVGRGLMAEGRLAEAKDVLQLNHMMHSGSASAANALADAYQASGNPMAASMYYQGALEIEPDNAHARKELAKFQGTRGTAPDSALAQAGVDAEVLAAMGVTPEQLQELEKAMGMAAQMDAGGNAGQASAPSAPERPAAKAAPPSKSDVKHESEYCEVLHRYNADKKTTDGELRSRVEGEYGGADRNRTWNVETTCGEFLVAVPLWADVSPPILNHVGGDRFEDSTGATWDFQIGSAGQAISVNMTSPTGDVSDMKRLGDPRSFQ